MYHYKKEDAGAGRVWSTISVLALVLGLAAMPAQAQIPQIENGACGPMDVVFLIDTTGSMGGAIQNVKDALTTGDGIIPAIINASGDDMVPEPEARLGLIVVNGYGDPTFDGQQYECTISGPPVVGDCIIPLQDLGGASIFDVQTSIANLPAASGGGFTPEITAEALRTIIEKLPQTPMFGGPAPPATPGAPGPNGYPRLQWNDWTGEFAPDSLKIVFLITDNVPGGVDSLFDAGDEAQAAAMATAYANAGVTIQPILVAVDLCRYSPTPDDVVEITPTFYSEAQCTADGGVVEQGSLPAARKIMQAYADATGGTLTEVPSDGTGTAFSIVSLIENCGGLEEKEGRMTGGGSVFNEGASKRDRVTHGFTLHCDGGPNNLQVNWKGHRFHLEELEDARCFDFPELDEQHPVAGFDTMEGEGFGRLNGVSGAKVEFRFIDDGEPGKVSDTAAIKITDVGGDVVLDVTGTLEKGNHQAHTEN